MDSDGECEMAFESDSEDDAMMDPNNQSDFEMGCNVFSLESPDQHYEFSQDGHDGGDLMQMKDWITETEVPSMSLINGKLRAPESYYLHYEYPVVFMEFPAPEKSYSINRELVQVVHLGHLGSQKIDFFASKVKCSEYLGWPYNLLGYSTFYDVCNDTVFDCGGKQDIWRAPCFDPGIHEVQTFRHVSEDFIREYRPHNISDPALDLGFQLALSNIDQHRFTPQTSSLLKLPIELQQQIWKHASSTSSPITLNNHNCDWDGRVPRYVISLYDKSEIQDPFYRKYDVPGKSGVKEFRMRGTLCLVNRFLYCQLSGEAAYKKNLIFFTSNSFRFPNEESIEGWMDSVSGDRLKAVKDIHVPWVWHYWGWGDFLRNFKALQHLTLMCSLYRGLEFNKNKGLAVKLSDNLFTEEQGGVILMRGLKSLTIELDDSYNPLNDPEVAEVFEDWNPIEEVEGEERPEPVIMTKGEILAQLKAEVKALGERVETIVAQPASSSG